MNTEEKQEILKFKEGLTYKYCVNPESYAKVWRKIKLLSIDGFNTTWETEEGKKIQLTRIGEYSSKHHYAFSMNNYQFVYLEECKDSLFDGNIPVYSFNISKEPL